MNIGRKSVADCLAELGVGGMQSCECGECVDEFVDIEVSEPQRHLLDQVVEELHQKQKQE